MTRVGGLDVSRETMGDLEAYVTLIEKWNPSINLVGKTTLGDIWDRHIVDSVQIFPLVQAGYRQHVDIGSGAGLPGLIFAILNKEVDSDAASTLIESDIRKATFLRQVIRDLSLNAKVIANRIEKADPQKAEIVTARALAPLPLLLGYVDRHLLPQGRAFLPKGATWQTEIEQARQDWSFTYEAHRSKTNPEAVILEIGEIRHV